MDLLPPGPFDVVYADPPWSYRNVKTGGSMRSGALAHYPTMSLEEICALPVLGLAARDAVLFLWVTDPLLPGGLDVMQAWGFKYKGKVTWEKTGRLRMGFWLRVQTETLLFGVRGKVHPFRLSERNIIRAPALRHSEKPEVFRALVERAARRSFESPRFVELFARRRAPGWTAWGNEVET